MKKAGFSIFSLLPFWMSFGSVAAIDEPKICYILDAILFIYGVVLTVLYCRMKKDAAAEGVYEALACWVCPKPVQEPNTKSLCTEEYATELQLTASTVLPVEYPYNFPRAQPLLSGTSGKPTAGPALLTSAGGSEGRSQTQCFPQKSWMDTEHSLHEGPRDARCSFGLAYLFLYYLLQFCGHTWIFTNMSARFLSFGCDAVAGTFYFVGVVMCLCQLLTVLELFHIADGLEESRLLPRFVQVVERNFLLFLLISQEEFQSSTIVCVLFYLWNILDLLRYPYELLCLISTPSFDMLWARHTVSIPVYMLSVITEGICILQALPYYESQGMYFVQFNASVSVYVHFTYLLMAYLPLLAAGSGTAVLILLKERTQTIDSWNNKMKTS
ncbi:hypothetical protein NFI96_023029 [Prochilodus magdalenae]|nr:hypothetical protein NFI96_023029 [Prochilodus magdalenae]